MDRTLRYHPLFDGDVCEAADWYDRRSPGWGNVFLDVVRKCVAEIVRTPEFCGRSSSGCRYRRIPRFPYVILFDVTDEELLMIGVLHTARSIEKWRYHRLRND